MALRVSLGFETEEIHGNRQPCFSILGLTSLATLTASLPPRARRSILAHTALAALTTLDALAAPHHHIALAAPISISILE